MDLRVRGGACFGFSLLPRRMMVRPAPDLLARPAVCGHPTSMILTRAPSRAPFALVVKITPGPQTCSRAPVGSPASTLRSDHRLALAFASGWLVHRTSHRQAYPPAEGCPLSGCSGRGAATGAALSPPRPLSPRPLPSHNNAAKVPRLMSLFPVRFSTTIKCWARQIRRDGERANRVLGMAAR